MPDRTDSALIPRPWRPDGLCSMFVCDIVSFGRADRSDHTRAYLRKALYGGLGDGFDEAGVPYGECYREDRGDGVMVIVPPRYDIALLITTVVDRLRATVRRHNELASAAARLQVRVAVHLGTCTSDGNGLIGDALNHAFRIMDAGPLKRAIRESGAGVGLVVSQRVYEDVVRHGPGLVDPDEYEEIKVEVKETSAAAWMRVPGAVLPARSEVERPAAESAGAPGAGVFELSEDAVFELVERLLQIPMLRHEQGRDKVVEELPFNISVVIRRAPEAKFDVYAIVRTCLDYPGGLHQLISVIRRFVGDSIAVYQLERALGGEA